jgi:predicted dehydrogenase
MRSLGELPNDYKVTATLTTRQESADEAARVYGIKGYHGDPSQLANDPDVDLVVVSVKVPYHAPGIRAAIEAGKDVFSEWPLALDLKEAEELAALAKSKSVRTMVGLQAMQDPGVIKAKELVDGGVIGRVLATHLVCDQYTMSSGARLNIFSDRQRRGLGCRDQSTDGLPPRQ